MTEGGDAILGSLCGDDRLARAMAIGVPSFVRRAKAMEEALETLLAGVAAERSRRLRPLLAACGRIEAARAAGAAVPPGAEPLLDALRAEPGFPGASAPPGGSLARVLREVTRRARDFNRRWALYLSAVPIESVRKAQADYNRYYPIEREMALRTPLRGPFAEVKLIERSDLIERFPCLPVSP